MKFTTRYATTIPLSANAIVLPYTSDKDFVLPNLPASIKSQVAQYIKRTDYKGKAGEVGTIQMFSGGLSWVVLVGLGSLKTDTHKTLIESLQKGFRHTQHLKVASVIVALPPGATDRYPEFTGRYFAEAAKIGCYTFQEFKSKKTKKVIANVTFIISNKESLKAFTEGVKQGEYVGDSITVVRNYGNLPSNEVTPKVLADLARKSGKETGQKVTIFGEKQMAKEKMGGTLGVSSGSSHEAQFIIMEHMRGKKGDAPIVLIGKGITFDSGGISIKPSQAMDEMKFDMSGGGTVIGTMHAIGKLKLPINVVGLVPATENVPSGTSYKPGDILKYADGTTVEVLNTDAEGRLILGDALIYARNYKPKAIIDLATLTGAIVVALGDAASALFSNEDSLAKALEEAATTAGEAVWRMPLPDDWAPRVQSKVADLQNVSNKSGGGSITAAKFLQHFVKKGTPWAHFDIAGTAWVTGEQGHLEHGATGVMVRTLVEYLKKQ